MKLEVPSEYLAAISLFADQHSDAEYQTGVYVEAWPEEARLVATDGAILGCCRIKHKQMDIEPLSAIIPAKACKVSPKIGQHAIITIEPGRYTVSQGDSQGDSHVSGPLINAKYPNYRKALMLKPSGKTAYYNCAYMATIAKVWDVLYGKTEICLATVTPNGKGPGLISFSHADFFGLLMPLNVHGYRVLSKPPEWSLQTCE